MQTRVLQVVRNAEKIKSSNSRPSSGNLWQVLIRQTISVGPATPQVRLNRIYQIFPKSARDLGNLIFSTFLIRVNVFLIPFVLLALLSATNTGAITAVKQNFDELVELSELLLIGTVSGVASELDSRQNKIYTYVTLSDIEVIKGTFADEEYVVRTSGGIVGDVAEIYPGLPRFEKDKRYILFLRGNFHDMFPVVGIHQGIFRVEWDADRQEKVVRAFHGKTVPGAGENRTKGYRRALSPPKEDLTIDQFVQRVRERLHELE